jgi:hypothetical protein
VGTKQKTNFVAFKGRALSSGILRRVVLVRTSVSEGYIVSITARSKDLPHDGRRREPLATAPPQSCTSVTEELLLMDRYFVKCVRKRNIPTKRSAKVVPTFAVNDVAWSVQRIIAALNLRSRFSRPDPLFFIQVAPE